MSELTYALPPPAHGFHGALSNLKRFTQDLSRGVTDSGAHGFQWSSSTKAVQPKPPQAPAPAHAATRGAGLDLQSNHVRPRSQQSSRSQSLNSKSCCGKADYTKGLCRIRVPSQLPSLKPEDAGIDLSRKILKPLPDPRGLSVSVPRAFHHSIELTPSDSGALGRLVSPRPLAHFLEPDVLDTCVRPATFPVDGSNWSQSSPRYHRSFSAAARTSATIGTCSPIEVNPSRPLPRPPAIPKPKSVEDYISKASAELLSAPRSPVLTWCTSDSDADYRRLQPGEYFNHFQHNKELTTKSGLATNLSQYTVASGINVDKFFPRCYDVTQRSEREDFILDFRRCAALKVASLHLGLTSRSNGESSYLCNTDVLRAARCTLRCWCRELDPELYLDEPRNDSLRISECTWDALVLYSELTEAQLCCKVEEDDAIARHPLRRYHRIGGGDIADGNDESCSGSATASDRRSVRRPADVRLWYEFHGHSWQPAQESDCEGLRQILETIEALFSQFGLQSGWVGRNVWIVKPGTSSKGSGVECMSTLPELLHHCDTMPNRIIQKYIERPLLLFSGRKFDIRQWVLVRSVSPLRVFLFSECYLRLCNGMYDLGDLRDRERHISNWQVNKRGKNVVEGAAVSLGDFQMELKEITGRGNFWEEELLPQLRHIVVQTLRAGAERLSQRSESFELYGFDLMVDDSMRMWLLEVNLSPGCEGRVPFLEQMLERMSRRLVEVAVLGKEEPDGMLPDWMKICDDAAAERVAADASSQKRPARDWVGAVDLTVRGLPLRSRCQPPARSERHPTSTDNQPALPRAAAMPETRGCRSQLPDSPRGSPRLCALPEGRGSDSRTSDGSNCEDSGSYFNRDSAADIARGDPSVDEEGDNYSDFGDCFEASSSVDEESS